MKTNSWLRLGSLLLWAALGSWAVPASAQTLQVTSANPSSAPQGSTNLIVKIGGSGFKKGQQQSTFYVSGSTTDTGGITVNGTSFVSSSEVDANITVSSTATLSGFDIYVTSGGRTGKGTDLFTVTSNGNSPQCTTQGPATDWTQVGVLNPVTSSGAPLYSAGGFGTAVRVQLVSEPDSSGTVVPQFYAGLAGSGSGGQTIAFVLNLDGSVRRSWLVLSKYQARDIDVGDVNGDGVPDFVVGTPAQNAAHVFIGQLTGSATTGWDYNIDPATDVFSLPVPANQPGQFGWRVAMGDLNGDGKDEVAVSATGGTSKKSAPGAVYVYTFDSSNSTWTMTTQISDPGASKNDAFGSGLAIGELTVDASGTRLQDLAVAASNAGFVYVFQNPLGSASLPMLTFPVPTSAEWGDSHAGVGDVNGDGFPDLIAVIGSSNGTEEAEVFSGPLYASESPMYTLYPDSSLASNWGTGFGMGDIDGDGKVDVLVGAPNADYGTACGTYTSAGAAYVFRTGATTSSGTALFPSYSDLFEVPVLKSTYMGFGWSVAAAPYNSTIGQPIVLIGENGAMVGTQDAAGQIYIYRKTQ